MIKPRKSYRGSELLIIPLRRKGQSVIEYAVIFAVVAVVSVVFLLSVPGIFSTYVANATGNIM